MFVFQTKWHLFTLKRLSSDNQTLEQLSVDLKFLFVLTSGHMADPGQQGAINPIRLAEGA